jgi:iron complex outermembrane receptor protein
MLKKIFLLSAVTLGSVSAKSQQLPVRLPVTTGDNDDSAAVSPEKDTAKSSTELQAIEVRSVRALQNSPFAKTNISKQEIARQNLGQDLPMLLQFTPSAVTTSDAGAGVGYTGIRIRGTDPTRINVTFNGMPVNDPEEQATFFVDIPDIASSTSSIQIQRGVGTSTNGAGAFGGTISISNLQQMDTAGVMLSSSYGSFNTFKNTLIAGTGLLKGGFQFDVRLSKISSDGYIQRSASDLKSMQLTAGWTPNDRTSVHFLFMPGMEKTGQAWNGVPQDSLSTNRTYNELGMKADGSFYNNQTDNYIQNYYQLFADHRFSDAISLHTGLFLTRGKGYYEEYKTGQAFTDYGLPTMYSPAGTDSFTTTDLIRRLWLDNYYYGGVFSLNYTRRNTLVSLGGGWNQFKNLSYGNVIYSLNGGVPDNYKWYQVDAQKNDANIYLKAQHTAGRFTLTGDIQYRNVAYFMNGFRKNPDLRYNVDYNFFNPKAGISYLVSRENLRNRTYASFAIGNREPGRSAFEADANHLPKPERLYDWEAGNELTIGKLSAGVNLYYMNYKDQLILTGQINDVGAYTPTNVASSYRTGIEIMAGIDAAWWFRVYGNVTLSANKINNFTEYIDNYDSTAQRAVYHGTTDISFSPNSIAALTMSFTPMRSRNQSLSLDITGKYVGQQFLDNTSSNDRKIGAYNFVNVLLRYSVHTRIFKEITATLALNNLFSSMYSNNGYTFSYIYGGAFSTYNYYYPQAGFNVMGGLTFRL